MIPTQANPGAPPALTGSVRVCTGLKPTGLACCSRGAPVPCWTQGSQVLSCTLRGSVPPRASSAPPRETPEFVGTWLCVGGRSLQAYPARCHLSTPSRPQPGGGGASTGGQAAASPPPSSPIGAKLGEGATPGNRQPTNPSRASCLSFPTRSTPSALAAPGPAQRFRLSRSSNSPRPRWRGLGLGRGARPGQWQRLRRGDSPEPRPPLPPPVYLCPAAGPAPPPC